MTVSKRGAASRAVRFGVERLESRENPAGNVVASLTNGVLFLRGDVADNLMSVQQDQYGDNFVYGVSNTTINGLNYIYLGRGNLAGVQVVSDDGNDLVEMVNIHTTGAITFQAGNENDGVALYGVSAGSMNLSMEGGDDIFVTDNVYVNGVATLDGGTGFDTIDYRTYGIAAVNPNLINTERQVGAATSANNVVVSMANGVMYLRGDAANNLFSIQRDVYGSLFVYGVGGTTINGQTHIYLGNGILNGVQVVSDAGNDLVEMVNIHTNGAITVQAGNENDGVALYNVSSGSMNLSMEGGDDIFVTDNVYVNGQATLDGGTGFDTIDFRTYGIAAVFPNLVNVERAVRT
jgi:signal peptidase I